MVVNILIVCVLFLFHIPLVLAGNLNLSSLIKASEQSQLKFTYLQQFQPDQPQYKLALLELEKAIANEQHIYSALARKNAEEKYQSLLKVQSIVQEVEHFCERIDTEQECKDKAIKQAIESVAKSAGNYLVETTTSINTERQQANNDINVSQSFSEQTKLKGKAKVHSYELMSAIKAKNLITEEISYKVKISASVSAIRDAFMFEQLLAREKKYLGQYKSNLKFPAFDNSETLFVDDVVLHFIRLPSGMFKFGSNQADKNEWPESMVEVDSFKMMSTEVTNALYLQCVKALQCSLEFNLAESNIPVTNINFNDIQHEFIPWLENKTQSRFRLPTEKEWEYAAQRHKIGSTICELANGAFDVFDEYACDDGFKQIAPIKQFSANEYGFYDLLGNAAEWTADCWSRNHQIQYPAKKCDKRVVKGGSWYDLPHRLRASAREARSNVSRLDTLGFRLVKVN